MRIAAVLQLLVVLAFSAGCCGDRHARRHSPEPATPPAPYLRLAGDGSNVVQLQIALREFVPKKKGPGIWLCAVSHIGETNYYAALQRELNARSLVLFEGITAGEDREATSRFEPPRTGHKPAGMAEERGLQPGLAKSLGLVFQLQAINYEHTNFLNSDLTVEELRNILAESSGTNTNGEPAAARGFDSLMQLLEGGSLLNSLLQIGFRFVASSAKLQTMARLALIEVLAEMQGDPSQLELPADLKQLVTVLVQRRNERVLADLKAELPNVPRRGSVAIFYGAGHMPDLQKRLGEDLGYRPARQIWLTAFSAELAKAGISNADRQWIQSLMRAQLKMMRPQSPPAK